jgi:class 3 adenylate cyclase/tetratricopeptide (TPR) repeat protein
MASPRRERKVVTVLFADLVGFTARAESLDPEDVDAVLRPYHERLRMELERWGGTVEKFIGDAVVAVFGAPVAREDDPERAVRAALAIQDWANDDGEVEVRIAVNTGEALVALDVRPESGEGFVTGDVVNTASRLQAAAPVNGILVGEQAQRATREVIEYREAEAVVAKGKSEPVPVWEAVHARSRFGVDVRQHGGAPLVGRERELDALTSTLERVKQEHEPQLVTLVGVPGIGKSRLVWELFQSIEHGGELVYWRQGRSLPYGEGVSFWALAEMVKAQAGILEDDAAETVAEKLERAVRDTVEEDADWVIARLGPLVGEAEGETGSRDESFTAWRTFLESLAERRPLVVVFEDIHWADDGLLDFIDHLAGWASGVPLLVLCTARPELLVRRPDWGGGKLNALALALSPLSDDDSARLLSLVLARAVLPAETQRALLERASGNPLYAEQYARLYLERGTADQLPLPESVHGLIAARLDTLPPEEKALLQDAAVMGKVFWSAALGAETDVTERLHSLERKEFIRRERRSSVAGVGEYGFRHVLVRDVAYGQIARAERAAKHLHAAAWIESLGRPQDHAELLAHHCVAGLELERASGGESAALAPRAARALGDAGDRAAALKAFTVAIAFYRHALELTPEDVPERADLLFRLGRAEFYGEGGGRESLAAAGAALEARGDLDAAAEAEGLLAVGGLMSSDPDQGQFHLDRAARLVEAVPASRAKASVISTRARLTYLRGHYPEALELAREALSMAESLGLESIRAEALLYSGSAKFELGDPTGVDDMRESIAASDAINSPDSARGYNNLSAMLYTEGRVVEARETAEEARRVAERFGLVPYIRWDRIVEAGRLFELAEWDDAVAAATELITEIDAGTQYPNASYPFAVRAQVRVARDDAAGAVHDSTRGLDLSKNELYPQAVYPPMAVHVYVLTATGSRDEGRKVAAELIARRNRMQDQFPFAGGSRIVWAFEQAGLLDELVAYTGAFRRTPWVEAADAVLGGDWDAAAAIYARCVSPLDEAFARLQAGGDANLRAARDFYRSVNASKYVREAEAQLAATA